RAWGVARRQVLPYGQGARGQLVSSTSLAQSQQAGRKARQRSRDVGMAPPQNALADGQGALVPTRGVSVEALQAEALSKRVGDESDKGVIGTKSSLPPLDDAIELPPGLRKISQFVAHEREVIELGHHSRVIRTEAALVHPEGSLVQHTSPQIVPFCEEADCEVVQLHADQRVVGSERLLGDGQATLPKRPSTGKIAQASDRIRQAPQI